MVKTRKGVISAVIMGFILIIGLIVFMILPVFVTKVSITRTVKTEYDWNNADSALLGLLSHDDVREQINPYVYGDLDKSGFESRVIELLDKLVITGCYELSYSINDVSDETIVEKLSDIDGEECTPNRLTKTFIAAPYGQPPVKIMLKISQ